MEMLQLRYFFESAKNGSFAKTAKKYDVPSTSVSAAIKRLEEENKKLKITGVVYNLPSIASVKIFTPTITYFDEEMPIAQFGITDVLSSTLFNKGTSTKVTLNPATGGIKSIEK